MFSSSFRRLCSPQPTGATVTTASDAGRFAAGGPAAAPSVVVKARMF